MNNRWIIVFDWETDGTDPTSCNPVELAAVPIEPRTLEIKTDKAFRIFIQKNAFKSNKMLYIQKMLFKEIKHKAPGYFLMI